MNIKDHIGANREKVVTFQYYREGNLYYKTELGLEFPVPISDIGEATFLATDRAILFMRYIRKQIELINQNSQEI